MRSILLLVVLCGGCKLHESIKGVAEDVRGATSSVKAVIDDVKVVSGDIRAVVATARTVADELAADKDGDGSPDLSNLLGGGGLLAVLGKVLFDARRNSKSDDWKSELDDRSREASERLAKLEAKAGG